MSKTPPDYRYAPPLLGQHTDEVLKELLHMSDEDIQALMRDHGVSPNKFDAWPELGI